MYQQTQRHLRIAMTNLWVAELFRTSEGRWCDSAGYLANTSEIRKIPESRVSIDSWMWHWLTHELLRKSWHSLNMYSETSELPLCGLLSGFESSARWNKHPCLWLVCLSSALPRATTSLHIVKHLPCRKWHCTRGFGQVALEKWDRWPKTRLSSSRAATRHGENNWEIVCIRTSNRRRKFPRQTQLWKAPEFHSTTDWTGLHYSAGSKPNRICTPRRE